MNIHHSHNKDFLIKIIRLLKLPIKYSNTKKSELLDNISYWCEINEKYKFTRNPLFLSKTIDLIEYLSNANINKKTLLCVKDREKLMKFSRRIIAFVDNGCDYDLSIFKDKDDLHFTILWVCKYGGSISTCRRSIDLINNTLPPDKKYEMCISDETEKELRDKEIHKALITPKFHRKDKRIILSFD